MVSRSVETLEAPRIRLQDFTQSERNNANTSPKSRRKLPRSIWPTLGPGPTPVWSNRTWQDIRNSRDLIPSIQDQQVLLQNGISHYKESGYGFKPYSGHHVSSPGLAGRNSHLASTRVSENASRTVAGPLSIGKLEGADSNDKIELRAGWARKRKPKILA